VELTEERVREIAREEATKALTALREQVADTPQRADGNINARDFYESIELAEKAMRSN
jgi:hypothetical protein